jgi:hypothetical protein
VRRGASPDYTVATDPDTGGPTVTITAKAPTGRQALLTTGLVSSEFRRQLAARQADAGAPASSLITASPVVTPTAADRLVSGRIRALVAVIGVGAVLSICLALGAETLALGSERRRADQEAPGVSDDTPAGPTPEEPLVAEQVAATGSVAGSWR